jgi:uncharacterized RDD family membrane protein YckC
MTDTQAKPSGPAIGIKPHAYDPATMPELFEGVLPRRVVAFIIDFVIVAVPVLLAAICILVFGFLTLGLGWIMFWLLGPAAVIWALLYYGVTLGSPASATIGMRLVDIEMRTWYGSPAYAVLGAAHAVVFYITVSALTPFILIVALLNRRRRTLHDMLVGAIIINNPARADALRRPA